MNNLRTSLLILVAMAVSACGSFRYDGQTFKSANEALAYQDQVLSSGVKGLKPAPSRVGGTLRMYFPNQDVIRAKTITGNPSGDYLVKATLADVAKVKEAFEQRKAFDTVELLYSQGEHRNPESGVHVLYFYAESPQVLGWYYVGRVVPKSPIAFDRGTADKTEKYRLFTESVESLAMAEKVATKK